MDGGVDILRALIPNPVQIRPYKRSKLDTSKLQRSMDFNINVCEALHFLFDIDKNTVIVAEVKNFSEYLWGIPCSCPGKLRQGSS